jgi:hypothetical protein
MSHADLENMIVELRANRYINFNSLMGSIAQLKKSISLLEDRIKSEGDNINFSVNSDVIDNAMILWKSSHKIYQIDSILTQLTSTSQKSQEAAPVCVGDTKKDNT